MKKSDTNSRSRIAGNNAVSRRTFTRGLLAAGITAAIKPLVPAAMANSGARIEYDYIVVGAGAGGGPVAARLANAGYTVALLEAGVDPEAQDTVNFPLPPGVPDSGTTYQIPALAGVSAEHPLLSWDFYVKHYSDPAQQLRDLNYVKNPANPDKQGILYPRGSTLGGSTAHDAMVFAYPHDQDWDDIAEATGDDSWRAHHMRKIFERLEDCEYCKPAAPGHGFDGYIKASRFDPEILELYPVLKDLAEAGQTTPLRPFSGRTQRVT